MKSAQLGAGSSAQILLPQLLLLEGFDNVTEFKCPVFFFAGVHDRTTPTSIVEAYYSRIQAPKKGLFKIERAAHYVVNEAPGEVLVDLVNDIRPLYQSDAHP
jgi:pimeloyl-ACP methyl ester carboxylesterase